MKLRRMTGLELDGTTVTVTIGKYQFDAKKVSYGDNLAPEELRQMGRQEIDALTPGTYTVEEGSLLVSASVYRGDILPLLETNGFGNTPHNIVVSFTHSDLGSDSDMLEGCRIIGLKSEAEASATPLEVPLKLKYRQVYWGDERKTINRLGDVYQSPGFSRLD